jgi:GT2 family glycosyltransferase
MDDVAICIVTHNDFFVTKLTIERLLKKTGIKPRLYLVDNGSTDQRVIDFCAEICKQNAGYFKILKEQKGYSQALNEVLRIVYQKYCVVFPINAFVHENWLEDLIENMKSIPTVGISSIRHGGEKTHFMPLIHLCDSKPEDELRNVLITENNSVEGILCFDRNKCDTIGFFDELKTSNVILWP